MKLPCVGETRAPPIATPFEAGAIDQRAGRPRHARRARASRPGSRILKDAAGARRVERLRPLAERQRLARRRAQRRRVAGRHAKRRRQQHLAGPLQAAAIVAERHRRRRHVARRAVARRRAARSATSSPISRPPKCALPKMAPPTVPGVPAHASRPAAPCVIVQRTRPLIVTAASARTLVVVEPMRSRRRAAG